MALPAAPSGLLARSQWAPGTLPARVPAVTAPAAPHYSVRGPWSVVVRGPWRSLPLPVGSWHAPKQFSEPLAGGQLYKRTEDVGFFEMAIIKAIHYRVEAGDDTVEVLGPL